jgi:hypothetical protein
MLTGRFELRRTWRGKIVLQIEEEVKSGWLRSRSANFRRRWRDATVMDLATPEMRSLIDLRHKPRAVMSYETRSAVPSIGEPTPPNAHDGLGLVEVDRVEGSRSAHNQ